MKYAVRVNRVNDEEVRWLHTSNNLIAAPPHMDGHSRNRRVIVLISEDRRQQVNAQH